MSKLPYVFENKKIAESSVLIHILTLESEDVQNIRLVYRHSRLLIVSFVKLSSSNLID